MFHQEKPKIFWLFLCFSISLHYLCGHKTKHNEKDYTTDHISLYDGELGSGGSS